MWPGRRDGSLGERTHTGTLWTSPPRPPRAPSRLPHWPRETSTRFRRRVAGDPHPPRRSYSEDTVFAGARRPARRLTGRIFRRARRTPTATLAQHRDTIARLTSDRRVATWRRMGPPDRARWGSRSLAR